MLVPLLFTQAPQHCPRSPQVCPKAPSVPCSCLSFPPLLLAPIPDDVAHLWTSSSCTNCARAIDMQVLHQVTSLHRACNGCHWGCAQALHLLLCIGPQCPRSGPGINMLVYACVHVHGRQASLHLVQPYTTPHHTTPHHTTPHHTTPHHTTPHHTTPHHTTPHHTLSTPQLYSRAGCRVRSPRRQGPGTANRRCTNSVGCAHVPVPSTIPRDPAAPSTGRLGPGNGQRPSVEDG